jgi:2-haloacid dehalogenase
VTSVPPLPRPAVIAFDAYGTLFDLTSVLRQVVAGEGPHLTELLGLWRTQQLEYTWLRTLMGQYADFGRVTADALDSALARLGLTDPALRDRLLAAYDTLTPYPEVLPLLQQLRQDGYRAVILSNGTPAMLESAASHGGIREWLDRIFSVDGVRRYKPAPEVYALVPEAFQVLPANVLFVSANAWDVAGAATFGLSAVWVNRSAAPAEILPGSPIATVRDLHGLRPLLGLGGPRV